MVQDSIRLFESLRHNSIDELSAMLYANPAAANATNEQGISLLLMAIYMRNKSAIGVIKKFKTSLSPWEAACMGETGLLNIHLENDPLLIDAVSPDGFTLLGYSCFFGQSAVAILLIEKGADVNKASQNSMKVAPLHSASAISDYKICKLLLEKGAHVNAVQQGGFTALHEAAHNGNKELARLFLEYGANKTMLTDQGETAVTLARKKSREDTATFIENYS